MLNILTSITYQTIIYEKSFIIYQKSRKQSNQFSFKGSLNWPSGAKQERVPLKKGTFLCLALEGATKNRERRVKDFDFIFTLLAVIDV